MKITTTAAATIFAFGAAAQNAQSNGDSNGYLEPGPPPSDTGETPSIIQSPVVNGIPIASGTAITSEAPSMSIRFSGTTAAGSVSVSSGVPGFLASGVSESSMPSSITGAPIASGTAGGLALSSMMSAPATEDTNDSMGSSGSSSTIEPETSSGNLYGSTASVSPSASVGGYPGASGVAETSLSSGITGIHVMSSLNTGIGNSDSSPNGESESSFENMSGSGGAAAAGGSPSDLAGVIECQMGTENIRMTPQEIVGAMPGPVEVSASGPGASLTPVGTTGVPIDSDASTTRPSLLVPSTGPIREIQDGQLQAPGFGPAPEVPGIGGPSSGAPSNGTGSTSPGNVTEGPGSGNSPAKPTCSTGCERPGSGSQAPATGSPSNGSPSQGNGAMPDESNSESDSESDSNSDSESEPEPEPEPEPESESKPMNPNPGPQGPNIRYPGSSSPGAGLPNAGCSKFPGPESDNDSDGGSGSEGLKSGYGFQGPDAEYPGEVPNGPASGPSDPSGPQAPGSGSQGPSAGYPETKNPGMTPGSEPPGTGSLGLSPKYPLPFEGSASGGYIPAVIISILAGAAAFGMM